MPVTVMVYVPAEPEHDSVEVPEAPNVSVVGVSVHVKPVEGDTLDVRVTDPVKPCSGATVMAEFPETPAETVTVVGLAEIAKSSTV